MRRIASASPSLTLRPSELSSGLAGLAAFLALAALVSSCAPGAPAPRTDAQGRHKATIYRDTWGIPHIVSLDAEAGLYASGWAQAEDRLEQILKNFLLGMGEYAAAFGADDPDSGNSETAPDHDEWFRSDLESKTWDHYGTAQRHYADKLNPELRTHIEAFVAGINAYMEAHPDDVPEWWSPRGADGARPLRPVDRYMPVAFSRQYIWSWPAGQAAADLRAIGLRPSYDVDFRSSNLIVLSPSRTTVGAAALVIDPHLSWFGRHRYWEARLHAGDIHISGFATAGFPYVNLGHNRHIAWAHTTGGPDTADVYELRLDPANPRRYRYDDGWRELEERTVEVAVKGEAEARRVVVFASHHGPQYFTSNLGPAEAEGTAPPLSHYLKCRSILRMCRAPESQQFRQGRRV